MYRLLSTVGILLTVVSMVESRAQMVGVPPVGTVCDQFPDGTPFCLLPPIKKGSMDCKPDWTGLYWCRVYDRHRPGRIRSKPARVITDDV